MKRRNYLISIIIAVMIITSSTNVFAVDNNSWTDATKTSQGQSEKWSEWCDKWEKIKNSPTQMSLSPGSDETQLNFAWYSKTCEIKPNLKISDNPEMKNSTALQVTTTNATEGFKSNKATATDLKPNTRYYYSYTINGKWTKPTLYQTKNFKRYSFAFVGDPQIGASWRCMPKDLSEDEIQDRAVRNDSFNWNNTIESIIKRDCNISFIISSGDQIQSRDKGKSNALYNKNEIEYSGYLSPSLLKSMPVATTIGNHDSPSGNYSYHFNTPNQSGLGQTTAGSDYYYRYGNTLFIILNSNSKKFSEHKEFIENAIKLNEDATWRVVSMHHDIYGSGEHSSSPKLTRMRYKIVPILEANNIDVVLTGHDHIYSRSYILKGAKLDESSMITEKDYEKYTNGEKEKNEQYENYMRSIEDDYAVTNKSFMVVKKPKGVLYLTADSSTGSKYYNLSEKQEAYIASRWQESVPTYSIIDVTNKTFTINTYRTDNNKKIDSSFTIKK